MRPLMFCAALTLFLASPARAVDSTVVIQSPNFIVQIKDGRGDPNGFANDAEHWRSTLFQAWFDYEPPKWRKPCSLQVYCGEDADCGGVTTFQFFGMGSGVGEWDMKVFGRSERLKASIIPHEVNHTVFASHFNRPLPRWLDEGAATVVEDCQEHARQRGMLRARLDEGRVYSVRKLLGPEGRNYFEKDILAQYAQGHSLVEYIIAVHGRDAFLQYVADGADWAALRTLGYDSPEALETAWRTWFRETYREHVTCQRPSNWATNGLFDCAPAAPRRPRPVRPVQPQPYQQPQPWTPIPQTQPVPATPRTIVAPAPVEEEEEETEYTSLEVAGMVAMGCIGLFLFVRYLLPWFMAHFLEWFEGYRARFRAGETRLSAVIKDAEERGYKPLTRTGKFLFDSVESDADREALRAMAADLERLKAQQTPKKPDTPA